MIKHRLSYWKINNLSDYYYDEFYELVRRHLRKKNTSKRKLFFSKFKNNNNKIRNFSKFDFKRNNNNNHIKMTTHLDETKTTLVEDRSNELEEQQPSFVVLKVNVRLNILNKHETIRQKEQSLVMRVPVEKLNNEATLDINLEDGVELANVDIIEMDQELELAEIDIIKLSKDENLNDKISEVLKTKKNENSELIEKLANHITLEQIKFDEAEEERRAEAIKREKELQEEILNEELNEIQNDDDQEIEQLERQLREDKLQEIEQKFNQIDFIEYTQTEEQLLMSQLEQEQEQPSHEEFDYVSEEGKLDEEEFTPRNSLSFRNKNDRLDLLKLEKIIEEEEGTFGSSTEWEEEIEWEEEEADWETNENEIKGIVETENITNNANDDDEDEKQWEKFDSEIDSLLDPIWSQKETSTYLSSSSMFSPINVTSQNLTNNLKDNSLDYDEEDEYFTDLEDKTIRTTPSSFDEWDDFALVKTSDSTSNSNERQNISIENKINLDEKTLLSTIEKIFQLIDFDSNGMIEFNDIIRVVFILNYLLGRNYSKRDAVVFFTTLDQDKDGKLDRNEFKNAFNFLFID